MSERMPIEKKKCRTPEFRVAFASVLKPKAFNNQDPKYSLVMLFDKKTDISDLKRCAFNATVEKWGADKTKWPKGLRFPFKSGDEKADYAGFAGTITVSASSKDRPQILDQRLNEIMEERDFYSGCYARATVIAFAYDNTGNKGVSFALCNLQKLRDGERFGGKKNAKDEFDAVEDNSEFGVEEDAVGEEEALNF